MEKICESVAKEKTNPDQSIINRINQKIKSVNLWLTI